MELIKKLGTRKNKSGNYISYGLFLCPYCLQEIERQLSHGKRDKSCGCMCGKLVSKSLQGKKKSDEHRRKNSESHKGKKQSIETRQKRSDSMKGKGPWNKGKHLSEEHKQKIKQNRPDFSGKNNPMYGKSRELSPVWQGGKSEEEYGSEWTKELKSFIKQRDLNICQTPNCFNNKRLCIHHIDYNKKNNDPNNLITLCRSCHTKTNYNRNYYQNYYTEIRGIYLWL